MPSSRVVIATNDEWIAKLIAAPLGERGALAMMCKTAAETIAAARADRPDVVVCDAMLPDEDAVFVVRALRETPTLGKTAVLVLCHVDDATSRIASLRAGADGWIAKPFRVEEACLQIEAMTAFVRRVDAAASDSAPSSTTTSRLEGDIGALSLPTVLSVLELEHRSGTLHVRGARQTASVELAGGSPVRATLGGDDAEPLAVLRRVLRWKTGQFSFKSGSVTAPIEGRTSVNALLIEAARLEDESPMSTEAPPPPSQRPPPEDFQEEEAPTVRRDEPSRAEYLTIAASDGPRPSQRTTQRLSVARIAKGVAEAAPKLQLPRPPAPKPPPPRPPPPPARPKAVTVDDIEAEVRAARPLPPPLLERPVSAPRPRPVPPRPPAKK